jgi:chorismate--pyruvate lyase
MKQFKQNWREYRPHYKTRIPAETLSWLLEAGSLTQRIKLACGCGAFRVNVLNEAWQYAGMDEYTLLGVRENARVLVREVQLLCDETPWLYARSLIPATTYTGRLRRLKHHGSRSLGAALFADRTMRRDPLQIIAVQPDVIPGNIQNTNRLVWGRRSVFYLQDQPLLVAEYFLPDIYKNSKDYHPSTSSG